MRIRTAVPELRERVAANQVPQERNTLPAVLRVAYNALPLAGVSVEQVASGFQSEIGCEGNYSAKDGLLQRT